jgi:hypothetical protein
VNHHAPSTVVKGVEIIRSLLRLQAGSQDWPSFALPQAPALSETGVAFNSGRLPNQR